MRSQHISISSETCARIRNGNPFGFSLMNLRIVETWMRRARGTKPYSHVKGFSCWQPHLAVVQIEGCSVGEKTKRLLVVERYTRVDATRAHARKQRHGAPQNRMESNVVAKATVSSQGF